MKSKLKNSLVDTQGNTSENNCSEFISLFFLSLNAQIKPAQLVKQHF
jgi:hypothetical protein